MKNGKALTSKELGLPSGVRLSKTVNDNVIRVAIRQGFNKDGMDLAEQECELALCINEYAFPLELRDRHREICALVEGRILIPEERFHYYSFQTSLDISSSLYDIKLGNYGYHYRSTSRDKYGILCHTVMDQYIKEEDVWWKTVEDHSSDSYMWVDRHFIFIQPRDYNCQPSDRVVWERLPGNLQRRIIDHIDKCDEFISRMDRAREALQRVIYSYSSAVKLCNDAPEFVDWINEAQGMNAAGRKCTDVNQADDIVDVRRNLGISA